MASSNMELFVDESYLIALINDDSIPISDEKYANELSIQEALVSSYIPLQNPTITHNRSTKTEPKKPRRILENGESSQTKKIFCNICMEMKESREIFTGLPQCDNNHAFCTECVTCYVTSKIKENISLVECPYPKCQNRIDPNNCMNILPREVFVRWENALCEALILGSEKFYCPYKECSALMVADATEAVGQAECPNCRKLFCARCQVKWHVGVTCEEFKLLRDDERGYDDLMVLKLAKDNKWRRCRNCSFYVEKSDGCLHMTCRCKYEFCYQCGKQWSSSHGC
ncbi:hypothetical protein vseg_004061 [Gypsophila vaccaria]